METPNPEHNAAKPAEPSKEPAKESVHPAPPPVTAAPNHKKAGKRIVIGIIVVFVVIAATHWYIKSLETVSTDDAYVDGHVTFVTPRVAGQVTRVFIDDNNRVRKGDLLVQLDKEPYQVQVNIARSAVIAAQAELDLTQAQAQALVGQARGARFNLQHTIEDVQNQIALLHSKVASLESQKATLLKAQGDYDRALPLLKSGNVSPDEFESRKEALSVAKAGLEEALQSVYQVRVSLGLPPKPETGDDLTQVPADLDQTFSSVRQAQAALLQAASQLGITISSFDQSPKDMLAEFYRRDPSGNIDKIYEQVLKNAPTVKQAQAKLLQANRNLDEANLNLSYTDVYAEIDGVVTRREVNPGNNVVAGQSLMALRSLTDIWIDANFKETQLATLRIGQTVDLDVDMYGRHKEFKGRISGFTMGTGSTLALLPAENATGNFVKVVQRLPVRIELIDYDPDTSPLFIGLSVTPTVHVNEQATGPNAGEILQPYLAPTLPLTTAPATATSPATAP